MQFPAEVRIANVSGHNRHAVEHRDGLEPSPVVERVIETEGPHLRPGGDQMFDEMRSDKTVRTGNQHAFVFQVHSFSKVSRYSSWRSLSSRGLRYAGKGSFIAGGSRPTRAPSRHLGC